MKLVYLDGVYFNADRIDTLPFANGEVIMNGTTKIYSGSSGEAWQVNLPIKEVVKVLSEQGEQTDGNVD